jgi:hypothetical protein
MADEAMTRVPPSHVDFNRVVRDLQCNVRILCVLFQLSFRLFGDGRGTLAASQRPSRRSSLIPFVLVTRGVSALFALCRDRGDRQWASTLVPWWRLCIDDVVSVTVWSHVTCGDFIPFGEVGLAN